MERVLEGPQGGGVHGDGGERHLHLNAGPVLPAFPPPEQRLGGPWILGRSTPAPDVHGFMAHAHVTPSDPSQVSTRLFVRYTGCPKKIRTRVCGPKTAKNKANHSKFLHKRAE